MSNRLHKDGHSTQQAKATQQPQFKGASDPGVSRAIRALEPGLSAGHGLSASNLLALQRCIGNQAVARLIQRSRLLGAQVSSSPLSVQRNGWKTQDVGGSLLSWDPYGEKTLRRYAKAEEYEQYEQRGSYEGVTNKGSDRTAIWFATVGDAYDAAFAEGRPRVATIEVSIQRGVTPLLNAESEGGISETKYPDRVIVKENERGAFGIGRNVMARYQEQGKIAWSANPKFKSPSKGKKK